MRGAHPDVPAPPLAGPGQADRAETPARFRSRRVGGARGGAPLARTAPIVFAERLVDDMTEHWKPGEFKDTYHDDLMRRIKEKRR